MGTVMGIMMVLMVTGFVVSGLHGKMTGGHGGEGPEVEMAAAGEGAEAPETMAGPTVKGDDDELHPDASTGR